MDQIAGYVDALFLVFLIILFIRILWSWFPEPMTGGVLRTVYEFVHQATEWYLAPFRRFIPPIGAFDLSPIAAIIVLYILRGVFQSLFG